MRLTTLLLVSILVIACAGVYANGIGTTPEPTPPVGTGPITPEVTPPVTTTPMPTSITSPEVEQFNLNLVTATFAVDSASVIALRQAGWAWSDIYMLAHIANQSNRPILEVANLRSQGLSYSNIGQHYNMTMAQLITPSVVQTRVAGFVGEYGYQPIYYRTDLWGNPVLTRYDAERLSRMGYSWQNIAIAANISAETGASMSDILSWADRGYTWQQIARQYGVDPDKVMDVSKYPFSREPGVYTIPTNQYTTPTTTPTMQPTTPPMGAGPTTTTPSGTYQTIPPPVY
ncbi:MAG: hypothetical protein ABFD64_08905 [Armatimonadota bacterium]